MTNTELLKEKIDASGLKITYISNELGISRQAFYQRMNGKTDFKLQEMIRLIAMLNLNKTDREKIFFA